VIRVAITTDRFGAAAPPFADRGLEPVPMPCIRFEPAGPQVLDRARQAALGADLLILTSARSVELLWPGGSMPGVDVAAVGEETAAAVTTRRGRVTVLGRSGLASLTDKMMDRLGSSRVVFPHAAGTDPVPLETLRARAAGLTEFEIYRMVPVAPGPFPVRVVAFASPSAVAGWFLSHDLEGLVVGVIGPATRAAVARHREPDVAAPHPSHRSLAQALASYLEVDH